RPLAMAPGRELDPRGLPHLNEVVTLPPNQGHLIGSGGNAPLARGAGHGVDPVQPVVEGGEVPAAAFRADDPEPSLPLVERQPATDAEPGRTTVAIERRVAEGAAAEHRGLGAGG